MRDLREHFAAAGLDIERRGGAGHTLGEQARAPP